MTRLHRALCYQDDGEDARVMWRAAAALCGTLDDVPNATSR